MLYVGQIKSFYCCIFPKLKKKKFKWTKIGINLYIINFIWSGKFLQCKIEKSRKIEFFLFTLSKHFLILRSCHWYFFPLHLISLSLSLSLPPLSLSAAVILTLGPFPEALCQVVEPVKVLLKKKVRSASWLGFVPKSDVSLALLKVQS